MATHFTVLGPILGEALILSNAPQTLLSVSSLCSKGFTVVFQGTSMGIYYQKALLYSASMDNKTHLFYVQLDDVIRPNQEAMCMGGALQLKQPRKQMITPAQILASHWLHKRLNHASRNNITRCMREGLWKGMSSDLTPDIVDKVLTDQPCTACALSKRNKLNIQPGSQVGPSIPGQCLSVDYIGKVSPVSVRGFNGFYLFKCLFSNYLHVFLTSTKSGEMFCLCIEEVVRFYNLHFFTVERMRFDSGSTELAGSTTTLLKKLGITPDPAAVATQSQNPVEREVQTLVKGVGVMMIDQNTLTDDFWDYGVQSWVATSNSVSRGSAGASPDELVLGVVPDISTHYQFPFGCPVTSTKTEGRQKRFDVTSEFGVAVGSVPINQSNKTTIVHIPGKSNHGRAFPRHDVRPLKFSVPGILPPEQRGQFLPKIAESREINFSSPLTTPLSESPGTLQLRMFEESPTQTDGDGGVEQAEQMEPDTVTVLVNQPLGSLQDRRLSGELSVQKDPTHTQDEAEPVSTSSTRSGHRYSLRTPRDILLANGVIVMAMAARVVRTDANPTLRKAKLSADWEKWKPAIDAELLLLHSLGTYQQVRKHDVPAGVQIIQSKMDLKTKYDSAGDVRKLKARLVARGDT